jgi:hypothetical protein
MEGYYDYKGYDFKVSRYAGAKALFCAYCGAYPQKQYKCRNERMLRDIRKARLVRFDCFEVFG